MEEGTAKHSASCKLLMKLSLFFTLFLSESVGFSLTLKGKFLDGYELGSPFEADWLICLNTCRDNANCVSYNFNLVKGICQLNHKAIDANCKELLQESSEFVFHQIKFSGPLLYQSTADRRSKCSCNCGSERQCAKSSEEGDELTQGLGYSNDNLATSCSEVLSNTSGSTNGAYYLRAMTASNSYSKVYCHMTNLSGCGGGGWTLVMKIDGNQQTFNYNSNLWTSMSPYKEQNGVDLSMTQTLLPTYWSTSFRRICLGMRGNGYENWIPVEKSANFLLQVILPNLTQNTTLSVDQWKSLLPDSSLQRGRTLQGFNLNSGSTCASARIGILGFDTPSATCSHSRIGFGTSGSFYQMDGTNSCGNEARNGGDSGDKSIKAFGYIFIQ